jgi:hypothetical protein
MSLPADLETVLCQAYQEEVECYSQALQLTNAIAAAFQRGEADNERLLQLQGVLDAVGAIEGRISDAKGRWQAGGQKPGPKFQGLLDQVKRLIEQLAAVSRTAENAAYLNKERLAPQLNSIAQGQRMQRAYRLWRL